MSEGTYAELGLSEKSRERIFVWLKEQGIEGLVAPDEYHCTVVYSRKPIPELARYNPPMPILAEIKGWHVLSTQDGKKCLALDVDNSLIQNLFHYTQELGATWDWPDYKPHITVALNYKLAGPPVETPPVKVIFVSFDVKELDPTPVIEMA